MTALGGPPPGVLGSLRRRLHVDAWRLVEGQHTVATRRLVDSIAEHEVLEAMLERSKPPLPPGTEHLHYLLATPFRYPPLRHGSRFGTRFERGIWYGSEQPRTAMAEVAWYRLRFLADTGGALAATRTNHTLFRVAVDARPGVDLLHPKLRRWRERVEAPDSWSVSQEVGARLRDLGVVACRYGSARLARGVNLAVFAPDAFRRRAPIESSLQTWYCEATLQRITFTRRSSLTTERHEFGPESWNVKAAP